MTDHLELTIFSAALAEHLRRPLPKFLYHYTGQDGLLGIIGTGSMWATNIAYMNDSTEFEVALRLIRESLYRGVQTDEQQAKRYALTNPQRAEDATKRKSEEERLWRIAE